ncbi:hypothetical protein PO124_15715 [Bacillus licheniformis]|nr:hypothetical protein [Bacillus licheniformis]
MKNEMLLVLSMLMGCCTGVPVMKQRRGKTEPNTAQKRQTIKQQAEHDPSSKWVKVKARPAFRFSCITAFPQETACAYRKGNSAGI